MMCKKIEHDVHNLSRTAVEHCTSDLYAGAQALFLSGSHPPGACHIGLQLIALLVKQGTPLAQT